MSDPKHTPGPWHIGQPLDPTHSSDASIYAEIPSRNNPKWIARIYGEGSASKIVEERNANARLIASAPFLLLAVEEILAELDNRPPPRQGYRHPPDTGGMVLARQAIAQATGQPDPTG